MAQIDFMEEFAESLLIKLSDLDYILPLKESKEFLLEEDSDTDPYFPRIEIQVTGLKDVMGRDQRNTDTMILVALMGYVKYDDNMTHFANSMSILNRVATIKSRIYSFNTDIKLGKPVASGFQMIPPTLDAQMETTFDNELCSFLVLFEARFILKDSL